MLRDYALLCFAMLDYATLRYAMQSYATPRYATLCKAMLRYAILCYATLRHAMLALRVPAFGRKKTPNWGRAGFILLGFAMLCYDLCGFALLHYAMLYFAVLRYASMSALNCLLQSVVVCLCLCERCVHIASLLKSLSTCRNYGAKAARLVYV